MDGRRMPAGAQQSADGMADQHREKRKRDCKERG